ncbi:MAG: DMT family transporter [Bacteroidia bacterium]|nr:DMT family transporter [Bacteroidia bacterium]
MLILYLAIIFILGFLAPVQTSANAEAKGYLNSPIVASLSSFLVGTATILIITLFLEKGADIDFGSASGLPWWAWCGGAAGMIGITANILLFPRLGSMQTVLMPMVGQIIAGLLVDSFGLFESTVYHLTLLRLLGFAAVMAGVFCVVSHKGKHFRRKDTLVWQISGNIAGGILALQPAMNSKLAVSIGSPLVSSCYSFITATILLLAFCCLFKEHRENICCIFTVKRPLWTWCGGILGTCFVVGQTLLVQHVGVGLLTILNIFGMLACSVVIDHFGLLGAEKRPVNVKKAIGLLMVAGGIILINI